MRGWHVFVKSLRRSGRFSCRTDSSNIRESSVVGRVNTVLRGLHSVTEMKAGYTGGDIDLHRIHSGDDMDKCKIYSGEQGGSVRIYSGKKRDELALC